MLQISILGCGWLGLPLAKALIEKGNLINGSTTSDEKISILKKNGINPFQIAILENGINGSIESFLENSSILIIDIPPKLRGNETHSFVQKIKFLIPFIENAGIEKVLFISSTSVYGNSNLIITEETDPEPETESGKQILEVEKQLKNNNKFQTTILRFGGLVGEDRNPINFLCTRAAIENPNAVINLIHQNDSIGIILKIIETHAWNETFNAVAPFHPTRENYYTQKAIELNLAVPEFSKTDLSIGKTILSNKIENQLNYTFKKPQL